MTQRATNISAGPLRAQPPGLSLPVLRNETSAVASSTPIPADVWDRLIAFKKARVGSASNRPGARPCHLSDKSEADTEAELSWLGEAARFGIEASSLMLYIIEWLLRVERGMIQTPSHEERVLMISLLSKLQRRSLDQHLRVSLQTIHLRRKHILPLCDIPEVAMQRFQSLTLVGDDLFASAFQETVTDEAERRDALKKTTFSEGRSSRRPFRRNPSRQRGANSNRASYQGERGRQPYSARRRSYPRRSTGRQSRGGKAASGPYKPYPYNRGGGGGRY